MAIRVYKPTSPARRFMSVLTFEEVTKKTPERSLVTDLRHRAGRNNQGKITVRHQGGGARRKYRARSPFATRAAARVASIASSTSSARRTACPPP